MQVICTAVSKAAALSPTKTTIKEIGERLGLEARMIGKCQVPSYCPLPRSPPPPAARLPRALPPPSCVCSQARFDALTDGEWEQLFEDRASERSDKTDLRWVELATSFWTTPDLASADGEAYNFVRRSERTHPRVRQRRACFAMPQPSAMLRGLLPVSLPSAATPPHGCPAAPRRERRPSATAPLVS